MRVNRSSTHKMLNGVN